ncbi:MAG: type 1 glutamine amidotransferase domain-containing protein, partial [Actinomycetota bacterium]|nr:type 1 glutamine amidotransferase domain-containing protein [Actinomycetota bacterium]
MARILILMTRSATLGLLDGQDHPSGFWAEEFVVPYEKFIAAGHTVDLATIDGTAPTPDQGSLNPTTIGYTRPVGSPDNDEANAAHYREVIESLELLKKPMNLDDLELADIAGYDGIYISGGHGAMDDLPNDPHVTRVVSWILQLEKPFAVVCHGQSALLGLRNGHSGWPLAGYRMT